MSVARGIALKLTSVFLFMIMASLIKACAPHVPSGQMVFFRSAFALPVIFIWLAFRGDLSTGLRANRPWGHVWRGVIGVSAMACGFTALGLLPLPEVTAIGYAAPLFTVLLAALLLGERLRLFRMSAVCLGILGVSIVLWPRLSLDNLDDATTFGVALVLISAALRALGQIQIRNLVATESTGSIVFWFSMTASVLSLVTVPIWVWPTPLETGMLIGAGLIGGTAQIFLTSAYRNAGAAVLAPFDYASILFAILIGYFVFSETPTSMMLIGSSIIVAAGVLIIWRERQLGLARSKEPPNMTPHS